jgi:hypothetical protein
MGRNSTAGRQSAIGASVVSGQRSEDRPTADCRQNETHTTKGSSTLAGAKAGEALAFDRSASFYRHALALAPASSDAQAWRQHSSAMLARIQTALYRGNADAARGLLGELDVILQRSSLTRIQVLRVESLYLRGRSALAMVARHGVHERFLPVARSAACVACCRPPAVVGSDPPLTGHRGLKARKTEGRLP